MQEWALFKEKEFFLKQIVDSIKDMQKLEPAKNKEDLSILHGYCNIISAYIVEIYKLSDQMEKLKK